MPANLSPAYRAAEERFRAAITVEERIAALEEMLRVMPKHKGTDKLQASVKSRLAKLRRQPRKKAGAKGASHRVPREGAAQIVMVGPPNSGKSSLVSALTHANPEVGAYPYTTREAIPGMMPFEDAAFQLVDLPPVGEEHVEPWVFDLVRAADMVWLVLDVERALEGLEQVEPILDSKALGLAAAGTSHEEDRRPGWTYQPTFLVLTGRDRPGAEEDLELLKRLRDLPWPHLLVSAVADQELDTLARRTFELSGVIRVYSKPPGKPAEMDKPFTLPGGSTIADLSRTIHKDLASHFRFARVWGESVFDGQRVQGQHVLEDGDIVEVHF